MIKDILVVAISSCTDASKEQASKMIERAHRSKPNKFNKGKRDVYARFYDWKDSEWVKVQFLKSNRARENNRIYVEQKYGPDTNFRRNLALAARKELKMKGEITGGYVNYPAKLFVKYARHDNKYTLHKDFSDEKIPERVFRLQKGENNLK